MVAGLIDHYCGLIWTMTFDSALYLACWYILTCSRPARTHSDSLPPHLPPPLWPAGRGRGRQTPRWGRRRPSIRHLSHISSFLLVAIVYFGSSWCSHSCSQVSRWPASNCLQNRDNEVASPLCPFVYSKTVPHILLPPQTPQVVLPDALPPQQLNSARLWLQ